MREEQEPRDPARCEGTRTPLKERLTGAVILVALVVLLVPALLTGRRSQQPATAASLSASGVSRSYEIDLVESRRPAAENPHEPLPEPEPAPRRPWPPVPAATGAEQPPAAVAATADAPVRLAPTAVPQVSSTAPSGAAGSATSVRHPSPPRDAPVPGEAHRSVVAADDPAGGLETSITPAAAAPSPAANPGGAVIASAPPTAWAVQLGAFAGQQTAAQLVAGLRAKGFAAFMLEYRRDGKVLYRVRVGPEQDRQRALAIAERLNREGYRASVAPHP